MQESGVLARPTTRNRTDVPESKSCGHDEGKSAMEALADIIWELHEVCSGGNDTAATLFQRRCLVEFWQEQGLRVVEIVPNLVSST